VDVKGEILELKDTINTMVDQLRSFASEVTRVAREVGTDGKLGGQAQVPGVAGTWKGLTDSVNSMASNLTGQVRKHRRGSTAIASGNLSKKVTVNVSGEILLLKETINTMVDQLKRVRGRSDPRGSRSGPRNLGGQRRYPRRGTWRGSLRPRTRSTGPPSCDGFLSRRISPLTLTVTFLDRFAAGDGGRNLGRCCAPAR